MRWFNILGLFPPIKPETDMLCWPRVREERISQKGHRDQVGRKVVERSSET